MVSLKVLTQINFKRLILRNMRFFIFDILTPAAFYLLFTKIMNTGIADNLKQTYLVSMVIFATLLSSVITVSNNTLDDKEQHFWRLMDVTPLKPVTYYVSFFSVILFLTIVEVFAIELIAFLVVGVKLTFLDFVIITLLTTLGSISLMIFGAALTFMGDAGMINLLSSMLVFTIAMLSGLWWPLSMFPEWLQKVGQLLPTYQTADLIDRLLKQHRWSLTSLLGELIWIVIGIVLIIIISNRRKS